MVRTWLHTWWHGGLPEVLPQEAIVLPSAAQVKDSNFNGEY